MGRLVLTSHSDTALTGQIYCEMELIVSCDRLALPCLAWPHHTAHISAERGKKIEILSEAALDRTYNLVYIRKI